MAIQVPVVCRHLPAPSPSLINMARIPVEGVGGLGLVAAVIVVAIWDPGIRVLMMVAAALGTLLAAGLVALRRRFPLGSGTPSRIGPRSEGRASSALRR